MRRIACNSATCCTQIRRQFFACSLPLAFLLIIILLNVSSTSALQFRLPLYLIVFNNQPNIANSPRLSGYGIKEWDPLTLNVVTEGENCTGKLLLLSAKYGVSPERDVRRVLRRLDRRGEKPVALALTSTAIVAGYGESARDHSDVSDIMFPVVEVSTAVSAQITILRKSNIDVVVTLRSDDINRFDQTWPLAIRIICGIIISSICIATLIVAGWKLFYHVKYGLYWITSAKVFLALAILASLIRLWWNSFNPFFVNPFSYLFTTLSSSIWLPIDLACLLLVSLNWAEAMASRGRIHAFLLNFRIPFIITAFIMYIIELVSCILRGNYRMATKYAEISWSFYVTVGLLFVLFLWFTGGLLLKRLSMYPGPNNGALKRSTILMMIAAFFVFAWTIHFTLAITLISAGYLDLKWVEINVFMSFLLVSIATFIEVCASQTPSSYIMDVTDPTNTTSSKSVWPWDNKISSSSESSDTEFDP